MKIKRLLTFRLALIGGAILIGSAAFFLLGVLSADRGNSPAQYAIRLAGLMGDGLVGKSPPSTETIATAHLSVSLKRVRLPLASEFEGGGIARFGDGLLLVNGEGKMFWIQNSIAKSIAVEVPPTNLEAYRAAAKLPEFAQLWHDFSKLRYLDLLAVRYSGRDLLFLTFTEWDPEGRCFRFAMARLDVSDLTPDPATWAVKQKDWEVVHRAKPCLGLKRENIALEGHIAGGRMVFDDSKAEVIFSVGDYRNDGVYAPRKLAQEDDSDYGKIFRLALESGDVRRIAKGTRNPQGLVLTKKHELWATEHGPMGGDELNLIKDDANYGWPLATLGNRYSGMPWPGVENSGRDHLIPGLEPAIYAWVPSVGISGIAEVHNFASAWDGDLLAASLKGHSLYRLRIVDRRVQTAEQIPIGQRVREVLQLDDGSIALWTDSFEVIFLRPSIRGNAFREMSEDLRKMDWDSGRKQAALAAVQACLECHSLEPGVVTGAPSLGDVVGRRVASTDYAGYSDALRQLGGNWTTERLTQYIQNPQALAPGTSMPPMENSAALSEDLVTLLDGLNAAE